MSLALASRRAAISPAWVKSPLWRTARAVPSLDLPFADTKSLADAVTGQSLVTFTRASSGTYVGSDGLIKTAVTNLLLRSEEFDNASWARERLLSVTANAEIAPNGYLVAERIVEDSTASNTHTIYQAVAGLPDSTTFTFSVYLKAAGRTKAVVAFMDKSGTTRGMLFDLSQGTISSFNLNGIVDPTASNIVAIGNGWYRCSVQQSSGTGAFGPRCWVQLVSGSTNSYTGDGTSGLLLWGAQLEQSSTVGEYIPTTSTINSAPRFDHNPTTGESLGLLVEEQRTNLLSASEAMDAAPWGLAAATAVANNGVAPDGTTTADKIVSTGGGCFRAGAGVANATAYTYSVFLKHIAGTGVVNTVGFERFGSTPLAGNSSFNLLTGTVVSNGASVQSSSITRYPNNWFRVSVTATSTDVTTTVVNYTSISGNEFLVWGAQLEAGAFATSYIPTTTATVTRSADVASITGTAFSSWYRQDEGTVFASVRLASLVNTYEASFTDNSNNNHHFLRYVSGQHQVVTRVGGVDNTNIYSDGGSGIAIARNAYGYKTSSFTISTNGLGGLFSTTANTVPTVDRLNIGMSQLAAATGNLHVSRFTYWPQRLPNSTIQAITQ